MESTNADLLVLGLGGTVDYEISWDNRIVEELVDFYKIGIQDLTKSEAISSERELVCTVLSYLANSSGGETQVTDPRVVKEFSDRFKKRITLGGTGVRAALAMQGFGVAATQHLVSIDENVRRLLPANSKYICSAATDSFDPHLIIQFNELSAVKVQETIIRAIKADRIILTCDPPNELLLISKELPAALAKARLFLISGFNSIHDEEVLAQRLAQVKKDAEGMQEGGLIFFEDAGYHRPEFRNIVMKSVSQYCSFFSLNEEELQNYLGRKVDFLSVDSVVKALTEITTLIPVPILIIHTKSWSAIVGSEFMKYRECVVSGMIMATTRYIYGDAFSIEDFESTKTLPRNADSLTLAKAVNRELGNSGVFIPAYEVNCLTPTTIGLGDSFVGGFLLELSHDFL
jgi:ADP-dependent phosphofructokinase/glucokinase